MNVALKPAQELELSRELSAPRERAFAAWTDPEKAARWWVPQDCELVSCKMDVRPGGGWHRRLRVPDGGIIAKWGEYREVVAPERLVFTYSSEGVRIADRETLVTVTFIERGDRTVLTLRHSGLPTEEARAFHDGGWERCLDRFTTDLPEN